MEKKLLEAMELKLGEIVDRTVNAQEARFMELEQAIAAMSLQNRKNKLKIEGEGSSGGNWGELGRSTRYEFPKFDGQGFEGWVMRAEYFFQVARVPEDEQVRVAAVHLEGKAMQWHRGFDSLHGDMAFASWPCYAAALAARFGAQAYEDPLADLRNLKQTGSLHDYMDTFDELYPRAGIREDQTLSFFLSGLVEELQMPVRMFRPKTLAEAYSLAKLQELTVRALGVKSRGGQSGGQQSNSHYSNTKPMAVTATTKPVGNTGGWSGGSKDGNAGKGGNRDGNRLVGVRASTNLTSKEIDEKRARKECFWCTEKFTPNNQCAKRRSYVMELLEMADLIRREKEEKEGSEEEIEDDKPELQLSIHAVWGMDGPQVRIKGVCQKRVIGRDSGCARVVGARSPCRQDNLYNTPHPAYAIRLA